MNAQRNIALKHDKTIWLMSVHPVLPKKMLKNVLGEKIWCDSFCGNWKMGI